MFLGWVSLRGQLRINHVANHPFWDASGWIPILKKKKKEKKRMVLYLFSFTVSVKVLSIVYGVIVLHSIPIPYSIF
ncbi:hypothetical protein KFK09_019386 [Dendrobium nobile]|uniref:Uncharacterized protein n=1 Tax=Dendrobium nobile TaxID=94219 RepID=A0A8T3AQY6_DENNO|nr:hypothetical protein KFK09_019386 [Dendrobium nobile]